MRSDHIDDVAHASEFFVELAALHRRILLAAKMSENAVDGVGAKLRRPDKHAALHHQLRKTETSEEGRLAALGWRQ